MASSFFIKNASHPAAARQWQPGERGSIKFFAAQKDLRYLGRVVNGLERAFHLAASSPIRRGSGGLHTSTAGPAPDVATR
jgi:hypothetical protein